MKKLVYFLLVMCFTSNISFAEGTKYEHPIDIQESECKAKAQTTDEWTQCSLKAANAWSVEVDKYYSLLYKKLAKDSKTILFEDQKYWNMYKNNEFKLLNSLYNKDYETKDRAVYRAEQKRNIIKNRANDLRVYYIQTFPDDDKDKIEIKNTNYRIAPVLQRAMHFFGF